MNTSMQGIIVNNCQYAPIYLIQDPATTQANTYVFTTNNVQQPKAICDNLKSFYENSGNIENGLVNVDTAVKPTVGKKKDSMLIGNNLKLASFLLPKNDNVNKQYGENVDIKPQINTPSNNGLPAHPPVHIVPKIDMDRKIVKVKDIPMRSRSRADKLLPKIKPKESPAGPNPSKLTAVQLVNVGGTYHSVNHLSKEQMKAVNEALQVFKDPDKPATENAGEAPPSTRYLYKVVSPKDIKIVGQKKYLAKDKKLTKIPRRVAEERAARQAPSRDDEPPAESKFTRSGRKVKLPKQIVAEEAPHKAKKKTGTVVSCFQCSAEFGSLYRLQKHYELVPTHIPAKIHSNLFHCLLAIVKGAGGDRAGMLLQQLHQLVGKLRALLPCLVRRAAPGQPCSIAGDVARVFGMTPGKYYIDVDALNCVKDKDGFCIHNPPTTNQDNKDRASRGSSHDEAMSADSETENCARINSVAKWPTVSKRIWKKKTHQTSAKKMKLKSEADTLIDLGTEELILKVEENVPNAAVTAQDGESKLLEDKQERDTDKSPASNLPAAHLNNYIQFHSAHFDIRSSPIKSSSTVFRKFQINPSKMSNYQVQVIRDLDMLDKVDKKQVAVSRNSPSSTPTSASVNISSSSANSFHGAIPSAVDDLHEPSHETLNGTNRTVTNSNTDSYVGLPAVSASSIQVNLPTSNNELHLTLPSIDNNLPDVLPSSGSDLHVNENSFDVTFTNTENSLHDIFKEGVDLACKEDSIIDSDLKDWIISTSDKSPATLKTSEGVTGAVDTSGCRNVDTSVVSDNGGMQTLDETDGRLLTTHGHSVLNFLDNLSNDLVYPETDIRNNGDDFQLDLFTYHNSV